LWYVYVIYSGCLLTNATYIDVLPGILKYNNNISKYKVQAIVKQKYTKIYLQ
jgi:hypothetical protein